MRFDYESGGKERGAAQGRESYAGTDYAFRRHERINFGHTVHRWRDWLKSRPSESWVFFAAGLVLGGIVL